MPKTTHTPGPWHFARPVPGKAFAIHAPTRAICGGIGSKADARLIAAAPELAGAWRLYIGAERLPLVEMDRQKKAARKMARAALVGAGLME